jgi:Protein of unknown function (DUF4197)
MKRWGFTITLTCGVLLACCAAEAQLDQILNKLDTTSQQSNNLPGMALSNDKIAGGLKEALTKSTGTAVASTGRVDGYFKNQAIKILLPAADVQSFADQYVAASTVAKRFNLNRRTLSSYIKESGAPLLAVPIPEEGRGPALFVHRVSSGEGWR